MEVISFRCAACKHVLKVGADKAGRKAKCSKCGQELTIPKPSPQPPEKTAPPAPATPEATETKSKAYSDDEDDDGGTYVFHKEAAPPEEPKKKTKRHDDEDDDDEDDEDDEEEEDKKNDKPKPQITRRKIKKKTVQFAEDWLKFRAALMLVFAGVCGWLLVWVLRLALILLGFLESPAYGEIVDRAAQGGDINMPRLTVTLLAGVERTDLGNVLFIVEQVVSVLSGAAFLAAFCVCLGVPNTFGTRGQAVALVVLSGVNLLLAVVLRLLPALGAIGYVMMPLLGPETAMNEANVDRVLPIHAFWCGSPFWENLAAILVWALYFAEPIFFCVFMRATALALKDDEWLDPMAFMLLRLGLGQFFIFLCYFLLSLTGTSAVLRGVLFVSYFLWRGFLLGFLIWYAIIAFKAKARVEYLLTADEEEED
jgi:hypothetical protein